MINVSIIDDNPEIIHFFKETANEIPKINFSLSATSISEYLKKNPSKEPNHFLFLDIHLKEEVSLIHIPDILEKYPNLEIIIYSVDEEYQYLINAFRLGATGYIIKKYEREELLNYFVILSKGGAAISPQMAKKLISGIQNKGVDNLNVQLPNRELQLLSLLAEGWTYQYIADQMNLSVDGIRYHIKKIYRKLKVNSRGEAVRIFNNLK